MDNERDKPQGGARPPEQGKIGADPLQATYQQTTEPRRVIKKTPVLKDIFWFVLFEENVLQFFVIVQCFVFILFWLKKVITVVEICQRQGGLNG